MNLMIPLSAIMILASGSVYADDEPRRLDLESTTMEITLPDSQPASGAADVLKIVRSARGLERVEAPAREPLKMHTLEDGSVIIMHGDNVEMMKRHIEQDAGEPE